MADQKKGSKSLFKITELNEDDVQLYTDTIDAKQKVGSSAGFGATFGSLATQEQILTMLRGADSSTNRDKIVKASRLLYATNPIYAKIIDYYANMYLPRYYVTPRILPGNKKLTGNKWLELYNLMVEVADGLNIDTKMVQILRYLFIEGGVYMTTLYNEDNQTIDVLILPSEYAQRVGETIVGTDVIQFNMAYFDTLGYDAKELSELFEGFPEEFRQAYLRYKADSNQRWAVLDPRFSSAILLNQRAIPTLFYTYMGINNYENYSQNELDKSTQALQTIVEHHIPTYQDKLLLEMPEMRLLHKKLSSIVRTAKNTRLVTTIGNVNVHQLLQEAGNVADKTLENAYKSIFDTAGLNNGLFYGDNQYSVEASMSIDRGYVWHYVEKLANFYNVVINNYGIDFKGYQLELTILPISRDKTQADIEMFRENAKVGVEVLPFIVASGVKQKDIDSHLDMEANLDLVNRLTPLRSSNTMASDFEDDAKDSKTSKAKELKTANEE